MKIKRFLQGNSVCSSRFVPCLRVAWPMAVITVLCASAAWSEMILVPATEMAVLKDGKRANPGERETSSRPTARCS